jgi:triosephosphate isomerase (TIM)
MSNSQRNQVIAGNWKMYKTIQETEDFIRELTPLVTDSDTTIYLSVPFTAIQAAANIAEKTNITIGGQNMNDASEGAFTGEISASMLLDAGAKFVILGHSERRHVFNESDEFINKKVKRALTDKLTPIVCIGETGEQRDAGDTDKVLKEQLTQSLADIDAKQMSNILVAYEPVWAIGTGKTATPEHAQEVHLFCRQTIEELWGEEVSHNIVIMYGGSVKATNARQLMEQPDIDGLLVGGASLSAESFSHIINFQNALTH